MADLVPSIKFARTHEDFEKFSWDEVVDWLGWCFTMPKDILLKVFEKVVVAAERDALSPKETFFAAVKHNKLNEYFSNTWSDKITTVLNTLRVLTINDPITWRVLHTTTNEYNQLCKHYNSRLQRNMVFQLEHFIQYFGDLDLGSPPTLEEFTKEGPSYTSFAPNIQFDLRSLGGDLGNPNKQSSIVDSIMDYLQKGHNGQVHLLVGESGIGKTKALFDLAREEFAIYLDFLLAKDAVHFLKQLELLLEQHNEATYYSEFLPKFQSLVLQLIGARIVGLISTMLKHPELTCEQWLLRQLHAGAEFIPIQAMCKAYYGDKDLIALSSLWKSISNNKRIIILCDEAQLLTVIGKGKFKPFVVSEKTGFTQSAYNSFVYTAIEFGAVCVAGTSPTLLEIEMDTVSGIQKPDKDLPILIEKHSNFSYPKKRKIDNVELVTDDAEQHTSHLHLTKKPKSK